MGNKRKYNKLVMGVIVIKIATDFSRTPGARKPEEGPYPGVEFRNQILYPRLLEAIKNGNELLVDLDGAAGYGTSFLEESFGGLIRDNKVSYKDLKKVLKLKSDEDPTYIEEINQYIEDAQKNE